MGDYLTIVADPPWQERTIGRWKVAKHHLPAALPYQTLPLDAICALPIAPLAAVGAHLWLWTTNSHLDAAFDVLRAWGFTYLTTVTWVKPSGFGAYFASTTQHCLFGYFQKCKFPHARWQPTHFTASVKRHSQKPEQFYDLVERVSPAPRLELFARRMRLGYDVWGDEVPSSITLPV
jgi:N6-adenosine-specific RNA methylase IME4